MLKLKIGDKIQVITGKDKGREGTIERMFPKKGTALVPGVNLYKRHIKKDAAKDGKGGVYDIPRPISLSKLALKDPKSGKPTRISFKVVQGKKVRIARKSNTQIGKKLAGKGSKKTKK
jgi:large subunit ribosomal protein L24